MENENTNPTTPPADATNPPVSPSQPIEAPQPKSNKGLTVFLVVLVLLLAGTTAYFAYQANQSSGPTNTPTQPTQPTKVNTATESPGQNPTKVSDVQEVDYITETNKITRSDDVMRGPSSFNLTFVYPSSWEVQSTTAAHENDTLEINCADYTISNPQNSTSVTIQPLCSGWRASYDPYPNDAVILKTTEKQGNDGHTSHLIRYYNSDKNNYIYTEAWTSQYEEAPDSNTEILDALPIGGPEYDWFFIPVKVRVSTSSESNMSSNDFEITDTIIKSLKLTYN